MPSSLAPIDEIAAPQLTKILSTKGDLTMNDQSPPWSSLLNPEPVVATAVNDLARMGTLMKHFAEYTGRVQRQIFDSMKTLAPAYEGYCEWDLYELSNGSFYMAPPGDDPLRLCQGAWFDVTMSADAAGITACLYAYNSLFHEIKEKRFREHYDRLAQFASQHAEAKSIFTAINN